MAGYDFGVASYTGCSLNLLLKQTDLMKEDDIQRTAKLLGVLKPGFLPYPIFEQIARLVALPIIEVIPLRQNERGEVEVLLIEREQGDGLWPGALHTPGTVIRATDLHGEGLGNWPAFQRIINDELQKTKVASPQYVGSMFHESKRGAEQAQLYWVEVLGIPKVGKFYPANRLPDKLIRSQEDFIRQAVENYILRKAREVQA